MYRVRNTIIDHTAAIQIDLFTIIAWRLAEVKAYTCYVFRAWIMLLSIGKWSNGNDDIRSIKCWNVPAKKLFSLVLFGQRVGWMREIGAIPIISFCYDAKDGEIAVSLFLNSAWAWQFYAIERRLNCIPLVNRFQYIMVYYSNRTFTRYWVHIEVKERKREKKTKSKQTFFCLACIFFL